ncbi:MAG: HPF/RaiA family ribosome-associated protein [Pseudobdellovibrio sp.]
MTKVIFKNLKSSDMAKSVVLAKIEEAIAKFPKLSRHKISATLAMENTSKTGPDHFSLKLIINGKFFKNLIIEKHAANLYEAISEVAHVLLERLNRVVDKKRVLKLAQARRFQYKNSWEHWYESAA